MSVFIFIIVLSVLIVVHEFGHFAVAKSVGVEVERFSLGFGPKLWSRRYKGTEFMVCGIPLGGYVKMAGDERSACKGLPGEYFSKPIGHRALIVLMGPVVNYVLAFLCLCLVFFAGYPTLAPNVGKVMDDYPAAMAGLQEGDKILQIAGTEVVSWEDLQESVRTSEGRELAFLIQRDDTTLTKRITPREDVLENIFGQKETNWVVGVQPEEEIVTLRYGALESVGKAATKLWEITALTYKAIYRMATGAMSATKTMTGPIGIFLIIKEAAAMGFSYLLYIVGVVSASLAIFNLLPVPVLDGGHLALLAVERLRGRALPERVEEAAIRVGFSLIVGLALLVFYADFVRLGWIDKLVNLWQ